MNHISSIKYQNYKAFSRYTVSLSDFNILVGPNNAGKSTIIGSLKILAEGLRIGRSKTPIQITGPDGDSFLGYEIDLRNVPIATENIFYNYNDSNPAIIRFRLSNNSFIQIFFPATGKCFMNYISENKIIRSPKEFKAIVDLEIGFVPILGPVEHDEQLYQKEAARNALLTYRASRNFRNIWYHYNEDFQDFKELVISTWPGMDIEPPEIDYTTNKPVLHMFCPEERIPRELFWSGYGFQVWCQMLTYIIKNKKVSLFLIDEPDIYLHSDLQRQLLGILKSLGPDIIIATHSTEIISEAEMNDILVINKINSSATRIKNIGQFANLFGILGSNLNPVLTQIAKTKKVLFVEGKDYNVISKFAKVLGFDRVANRSGFAVIPVEGFQPSRLLAMKEGIIRTIGFDIKSGVIFDKDYRSDEEITELLKELSFENDFAHIHSCKELENFLLVPEAIEKAIKNRISDRRNRVGKAIEFEESITELLFKISEKFKIDTQSQLQSHQIKFGRKLHPSIDDSTMYSQILTDFDTQWSRLNDRLKMICGKDFLSELNSYLQDNYKITITNSNIISSLNVNNTPDEIKEIVIKIDRFLNS
jgi:Predicted ATP-dependent endonuclease of the OLD family